MMQVIKRCPTASTRRSATPPHAPEPPVRTVSAEELRRQGSIDHDGDLYILADVGREAKIRATGRVVVWGGIQGGVQAGWRSGVGSIHAIEMSPHAEVYIGESRISPGDSDSRLVLYRGGSRQVSPAMMKSAFMTGCYATVLGISILLFPLSTYGLSSRDPQTLKAVAGWLFDVTGVTVGMIRLGGSLLAVVGIQYLGTAISDSHNSLPFLKRHFSTFYHSTIPSRLFLVGVILLLVCKGALEPTWLLLAAMNGIGALSMIQAIQDRTLSQ